MTVVAGIRTGPVAIDPAEAQQVQQGLEAGRDPWRADPAAAARADSLTRGFSLADTFAIVEAANGVAIVHARHGGLGFDLELVQPVKTGPAGAWFLREIRLARDGGA